MDENFNISQEMFGGAPVQDGTPYFLGDYAIVQFSNGGAMVGPTTYWLVDKSNNTIRPFESESSLRNVVGEDFDSLKQNIVTVTPPSVNEENEIADGVLRDFTILGTDYSVKEDGTSKPLRFSPSQLKKRYGKPIDENAEGLAAEALDGLLGMVKTRSKVSDTQINKLKKDSQLMAFYISALAYGGYTLDKVYKDILKQVKEDK